MRREWTSMIIPQATKAVVGYMRLLVRDGGKVSWFTSSEEHEHCPFRYEAPTPPRGIVVSLVITRSLLFDTGHTCRQMSLEDARSSNISLSFSQ